MIKFAIRGNALTAYKHSGGGKTPDVFNPGETVPAPALISDSNAIGGQAINYNGSGNIRGHLFPGYENSTKTGALSILHRFAPVYSGAPSSNQGIISVSGPALISNAFAQGIMIYHATDGNLKLIANNDAGSAIVSGTVDMGAWSPTAGVYYDFTLVWDGTTGSNAFKLYIDGSVFYQTTPLRALNSYAGAFIISSIVLGTGHRGIFVGDYYTNEYVLWDAAIDPTGSGLNLNGNSRSSFVTVTGVLDPTSFSDPGVANVRDGTDYEFEGVTQTGELVSPSLSDVKIGVPGDGGNGTYDGSDRWSDPGEANVLSGVEYLADAETKTGELVSPSLADIKIGVAGPGGTGTYDGSDRWSDPGEANVTQGVEYLANAEEKTGTQKVVTYQVSDATVENETGEPIEITQGDEVVLRLKIREGFSGPGIDLTGAEFSTSFKSTSGSALVIDDEFHSLDNQEENPGGLLISLTAENTELLMQGKFLAFVVRVQQGDAVRYFHSHKGLNVYSPDPTQALKPESNIFLGGKL